MSNLGMTGAIVKYIADYDAVNDRTGISLALQTAVISVAASCLVFVALLYPIAKRYFRFSLQGSACLEALSILPLALGSFWVSLVTSIYQGALYGCQLIVHRNSILVADSVSYLALALLLAPHYGLMGLACARLAQNFLTLVVSIVVLRKRVHTVPLIPRSWSKALFKRMFVYATNFQIIALLVMLADPVTKGFLSKYGNVSMVAYYEMANKLVQTFRSFMVNANQTLVPVFANISQLDPKKILQTYLTSYRYIFYLAVPGFSLLAVSAPLVSKIWIGHFESVFIWSTTLLACGWMINTLSVPAYYADMGTGRMKYNVISHLVMTSANLLLILTTGRYSEGLGVVLGWSISVALAGCVLNTFYYRRNGIRFAAAVPNESRLLFSLCLFGLLVAWELWRHSSVVKSLMLPLLTTTSSLEYGVASVMVACFLITIGVPMWNHYLRRELIGLLKGIRS